jgi:hypothetical protein
VRGPVAQLQVAPSTPFSGMVQMNPTMPLVEHRPSQTVGREVGGNYLLAK